MCEVGEAEIERYYGNNNDVHTCSLLQRSGVANDSSKSPPQSRVNFTFSSSMFEQM